jgi:hypothetical protein
VEPETRWACARWEVEEAGARGGTRTRRHSWVEGHNDFHDVWSWMKLDVPNLNK